MRRIRAALAVEVERWIARIIRRRLVRWRRVLGPEALKTGRGFDERAVHAEMLVAQQPQPGRLAHHLVKEAPGDVVLEQSAAVLGEHDWIEAGLDQAHIQEPTEQQVVVQLLTEDA